jgi:hypothetical protein
MNGKYNDNVRLHEQSNFFTYDTKHNTDSRADGGGR